MPARKNRAAKFGTTPETRSPERVRVNDFRVLPTAAEALARITPTTLARQPRTALTASSRRVAYTTSSR